MARYDREFLVPYLHDLCALYFAEREIRSRIYDAEVEVQARQRRRTIQRPVEPRLVDENKCGGTAAMVLMILSIFVGIGLLIVAGIDWEVLLVFVGAVFFGSIYYTIEKNAENAELENKQRMRFYWAEMQKYQEECQQAEKEYQQNLWRVAERKEEISALSRELVALEVLLEKVYSANIIPGYYRNEYVAVYLYDWFSKSGADDMDHALSMFVLEEIRAKLDRIIEQQAEMILNQRVMIAHQQTSLEEQRRHNKTVQEKLDRLQSTEEERLRYERMSESNTATTAYFAEQSFYFTHVLQ